MRRLERMFGGHGKKLMVGAAAVGFALALAGGALAVFPADSVTHFTGCLNTNGSPGGTFTNVAVGETPGKPCGSGQVIAHLSGGDITSVTAGNGLIGGSQSGAAALSLAAGQSLPQTCTNGQVSKWNGTGWSCADDNNTTYDNGTGLALSGTTFSVASGYQLPQTCATSQIIKWDGTAWACASETPQLPHAWTFHNSGAQGIIGSQENDVASLSLPAGSYALMGSEAIYDPDHNAITGCILYGGANHTNALADQVAATESLGLSATNSNASLTLVGAVTLSTPTTVTIDCGTTDAGVQTQDSTLTATQVNGIN